MALVDLHFQYWVFIQPSSRSTTLSCNWLTLALVKTNQPSHGACLNPQKMHTCSATYLSNRHLDVVYPQPLGCRGGLGAVEAVMGELSCRREWVAGPMDRGTRKKQGSSDAARSALSKGRNPFISIVSNRHQQLANAMTVLGTRGQKSRLDLSDHKQNPLDRAGGVQDK
jgi:hypothetical protein